MICYWIWKFILEYLKPRDITNCARTCKFVRKLCKDEMEKRVTIGNVQLCFQRKRRALYCFPKHRHVQQANEQYHTDVVYGSEDFTYFENRVIQNRIDKVEKIQRQKIKDILILDTLREVNKKNEEWRYNKK